MSSQQTNPRFENYVPVSERIEHDRESGFVLVRAEVYRLSDDALPAATGHAFEVRSEGYVNKTSYIENAETSAVGRALALLGYEIKRGVASREEMQKVERMTPPQPLQVVETKPDTFDRKEPAAESADVRRNQTVVGIKNVCAEMNAIGHEPKWAGSVLRDYVNEKFEVEGGLNALSFESLEVLRRDLNGQLDTLLSVRGEV